MNTTTLISANELQAFTGKALIVDCRFELSDVERGARDYAEAHVPGAVYADLNRDLSDLSKTGVGRHPLPDDANFSAVLNRWGWSPDMFVVAYDDAGGALAAARLWWMIRLVGSRRAAVLDGGLKAWNDVGFATTGDVPTRASTSNEVRFDASHIVMTDELQRLRGNPKTVLLDARGAPRYRGDVEPIDRVAGHVPGARNRPFADNLDAHGRFKTASQLRADFEILIGSRDPADVVHMCGSGVTACHNLLAMEHAGLTGSRVYAPSWSGWIADEHCAVAVGAE